MATKRAFHHVLIAGLVPSPRSQAQRFVATVHRAIARVWLLSRVLLARQAALHYPMALDAKSALQAPTRLLPVKPIVLFALQEPIRVIRDRWCAWTARLACSARVRTSLHARPVLLVDTLRCLLVPSASSVLLDRPWGPKVNRFVCSAMLDSLLLLLV